MTIIITGNPGVGKHTIGKKVSDILKYKILDINKIAIESGYYEKKKDSIHVDVKKLRIFLKKKIKKKSIIIGHLAPYVVSNNQVKKVIILRKNPYKLIQVYKKRKYSSKKIAENLESEILGITAYDTVKKFGKNKSHQIDTTSKTISKVTKTILNVIGGKLENDNVDWLTLVNEKNDLKKFFSY